MTKQFLLLAGMTALALGACGDRSETESNQAAPAASEQAKAPEVAEPAKQAPEAAAEAEAKIPEVTVEQLAGWRADASLQVAVFDANGPDTRKKVGVIPGAVMLKDYAACKDELPANAGQKLVFYCYNEMCGASHAAAKIAVEAGFEDVAVLTAGIVGWQKAGQPVNKL